MRTILALVLLASFAAGCARKQHLDKRYGESFDAVFATQRATPAENAPKGPVAGLDSQEAAIISDSYRNSLARKTEAVKEEPVLIVAPPTRASTQQKLAPSVPKE